jgi:hypothetical protein
VERELRIEVGAAEPILRLLDDHGVNLLLRAVLFLGHAIG